MSKPHPSRFIADEIELWESVAVRSDWIAGLSTYEIALKRYHGDRRMEPRVARILARLQDERHAARNSTHTIGAR